MASVFDRAKAHYYSTENPYAAGYLIPDGTWLDFSEGGGDTRGADHRNIGWVYQTDEEPTDKMIRFISAGGIRVGQYDVYNRSTRGLGFEIGKRPTSQQLGAIRYAVDAWRPFRVIVEIANKKGEIKKAEELDDRPEGRFVVEAIMEMTIPARLRAGS